jgi:hypothetical protein
MSINQICDNNGNNTFLPKVSVGAPSYTFKDDSSTGMYSAGAGNVDFVTTGAKRLKIADDLITLTVPITAPQGSVGAPSYTFKDDSSTGMYSAGAGSVNFVTTGVKKLKIADDLITSYVPITAPTVSAIVLTGDSMLSWNVTIPFTLLSFLHRVLLLRVVIILQMIAAQPSLPAP